MQYQLVFMRVKRSNMHMYLQVLIAAAVYIHTYTVQRIIIDMYKNHFKTISMSMSISVVVYE